MFDKINSKQFELLEPFFKDVDLEASIRELSRDTGVSPGWVSKNIKALNAENILDVEENSASKTISTGEKFKELKEIYNYWQIKNSGLIEHLESEFRPEAIILFGSFERGEDRIDSDIDIAIINGRDKKPDLSEFKEKLLGRDIEIQKINDLKDSDVNFRNSLANGKTLYGFMEVI